MNTKGHIQQARTSKYCGQACLAMLAKVPLSRAITVVGHRGPTKKDAILAAAAKLGLRAKSRLWEVGANTFWGLDAIPTNAIINTRCKHRKRGHWVCMARRKYDR